MSNRNSNMSMLFLIGVVAGYILSLMLPDKYTMRSKQGLRKFKNLLTDPDEQKRIKEIFKEKTDETVASYHMAKDRLARNLDSLKVNVEDISKDKYIAAVQDAIDYVSEYQDIPTPQLNALKKYLESDFNRIKSSIQLED